MGYCTNCGRPCVACSREADDFSLLSFPKETQVLMRAFLNKICMNNETDQSILISKITPYKNNEKLINSSIRKYMNIPYPPRSIPYLIGIIKESIKRAERTRTDSLPPYSKNYGCTDEERLDYETIEQNKKEGES